MIRIVFVLFFMAVLSSTFCRHLENTLSDARTLRKPNTVVDGNVLSDNSIIPTVSDDTKNSKDVLSNIATPIEERFSSGPLSSPSSSQDVGKGDSLDTTSQQKELISTINSDSPKEATKDIVQQLNQAEKIDSDYVKETQENQDILAQNDKQSIESIVGKEKESERNQKVEDTQSDGHSPSQTSSKGNGGADYEKNHGQTENELTSDRSLDASLDGNKIESSESDLPYVKLDNVNDANIGSASPVVRPELNHIDSDADKVQNIEISATTNDVSSSSAGEDTHIKDEIQNVAVDENQRETSLETKTQTPEATTTIAVATSSTTSSLTAADTPQTDNVISTVDDSDVYADLKPADNEKIVTAATAKATENDNLDVVPISKDGQLESMNSNSANTNEDIPVENVNQDANKIEEANNQEDKADLENTVTDDEKIREPDDVDPLDIFVDDIKFQRFPDAMPMALFKEKIAGKTFKKLYILESAEKKLFQHVRQLEVTYLLEDDELYAEFLFRFIYSRQCTRIEKFKLGKLAQNSAFASFEKEVEGEKTERLLFFSRRPDDYVFFMSCTDFKTSPYACRDTYYVTLDSRNDPPNQFPWLEAAKELESEMNLTFEDPRFIFNFVMMPCARG